MNDRLLTLAVAIARAWTWLYTLPLEPSTQHTRRAEIASDLWEFLHDCSRSESGGRRAADVLARTLLGIPDDVCWSGEQLLNRTRVPRLSSIGKLAVVAIAAS